MDMLKIEVGKRFSFWKIKEDLFAVEIKNEIDDAYFNTKGTLIFEDRTVMAAIPEPNESTSVYGEKLKVKLLLIDMSENKFDINRLSNPGVYFQPNAGGLND